MFCQGPTLPNGWLIPFGRLPQLWKKYLHNTREIFRDTDGAVPVYRNRDNARNAAEAHNQSASNLDYAYGHTRVGPHFQLAYIHEGKDYCDAITEQWVWCIGRRKCDGTLLASLTGDLMENSDFECVWLR
jgi:hypothetical protein